MLADGGWRPGLIQMACALACALVLASPAFGSWDSFEIIEWQRRDAAQLKTLRGLGVTAVMVMADRDGTGIPLDRQTPAPRGAGLRWYVENIATDFYASYHRYTPGKLVNWRFIAAQERLRANPGDETALVREPSLLDQVWRERIRARLTKTVQQQKPHQPLYYSLGDETGIADLSAFWDFDLSPASVAGFQKWLRGQYSSLEALNAEWGTAYTRWDSIRPETTRQAMRRGDNNFAAWSDFKAWMDTAFADALRFGTDTIHRANPAALSGIEGAQKPGWGGYDYTKLAHAIDVMEIYDDGENLPIVRSLNPLVIPLITSFSPDPHAIWRGVLRGARGLVLWDEGGRIVAPDGSAGICAPTYAPVFAALRGEIGNRMAGAEPIYDSVAVLYSPVSFRVRWMLDHRRDGDAWMRGSAEADLEDNAWRIALRDYAAALERLGLRPRFISPEQLAASPPPESVLILPHAIALSDQELRSIAAFTRGGRRAIADTPPGAFDEHGRRRAAPSPRVEIAAPGELARAQTLAPAFRVEAPGNDVDTYLFRSQGRRLLALQRHAPEDTSEIVSIDLNGWHARDLVTGRDYGRRTNLTLTLDPITPAFLEIWR